MLYLLLFFLMGELEMVLYGDFPHLSVLFPSRCCVRAFLVKTWRRCYA